MSVLIIVYYFIAVATYLDASRCVKVVVINMKRCENSRQEQLQIKDRA